MMQLSSTFGMRNTSLADIMLQVFEPFEQLLAYYTPTGDELDLDDPEDYFSFVNTLIKLGEAFTSIRDLNEETRGKALPVTDAFSSAFKEAINALRNLREVVDAPALVNSAAETTKIIIKLISFRNHLVKTWVYEDKATRDQYLKEANIFFQSNIVNLFAAIKKVAQTFMPLPDADLTNIFSIRKNVVVTRAAIPTIVTQSAELVPAGLTDIENDFNKAAQYAALVSRLSDQLALFAENELSVEDENAAAIATENQTHATLICLRPGKNQACQALIVLVLQVICDFKQILKKHNAKTGEVKYLNNFIRMVVRDACRDDIDKCFYKEVMDKRKDAIHAVAPLAFWSKSKEILLHWHEQNLFSKIETQITRRVTDRALSTVSLIGGSQNPIPRGIIYRQDPNQLTASNLVAGPSIQDNNTAAVDSYQVAQVSLRK